MVLSTAAIVMSCGVFQFDALKASAAGVATIFTPVGIVMTTSAVGALLSAKLKVWAAPPSLRERVELVRLRVMPGVPAPPPEPPPEQPSRAALATNKNHRTHALGAGPARSSIAICQSLTTSPRFAG